MSHNAIDYFAALSRAPGPFVCQSFPLAIDEDSPPLSGKDAWNEAITDIIVVGPDDPVDDEETWIFVPESVNGSSIEPPHLAFRRRKFSKRQDHITQIKFVSNADANHDGYEVIKTTISGKSPAQIKGLGYVAFKRAPASPHSYIDGEPMLYDICVAKKSLKEETPEKYLVVDRDISLAMSLSIPSDLVFAARTLPAMGLCNLEYKAATVDRYPLTNQKGLELPEEALPVFAFPRNLRLQVNSLSEYPLPVYYTFVFTDQDGHHQYAACLKFFERVPLSDLDHIAKDIWGEDLVLELPEDRGVFCPKVVCLLSSMPFYRAMRRYLRHMYSISLSSSICPIENFISSVVAQVPLPVEGGRPFHVVLDAALISSTSRPMNPIVFELPHYRFFPMMDLDFAGPMRCMNLDTMLAVFTLMLRESKMLFVSCSNTLLTETMETLRVLLFPLTWSSTFVSRLPSALTGLLQAPGGFMLGLHIDPTEMFRTNHQEEVNHEVKKYIQTMHFDYPMVPGTYIVDLTSSNIYIFNGKHVDVMTPAQIENLLKTLPNGPKMRLKCKLKKVAEEYQIAPQLGGLEEFDSAFDFQANPEEGGISPKKWEEFPTMEIRDSFMSFMIDLLGDYSQYIIPPNEDLTADTFRTFKEEFAVKEYLHDADQSCKQMLEYLMETQMFAVLLQQRSEGRSHPLVFFEQASTLQRQLGLSAGGHDAHLGKVPICVCELPVPIYKLLESENQWSCLSKVMQQQILQHGSMGSGSSAAQHQRSAPKLMHLTTSALSPLRSLGSGPHIVYSAHPITNQRLLDLLVYIDFTKTTPHNYLDEEMNSRFYAVARKEMDRNEDLHLGNAEFGPLLLPGPVLTKSMEAPTVMTTEEQTRYTYADGWPMLKKDILVNADSAVHPRLQSLRKERVFTLKQINPSIRMFIRSPIERLALESNHAMRGDEMIQIHHGISPMVSAIIDISSMAMSLLAIRAVHGLRPIGDILQILGIIAQLESWGLAGLVNETIWRSIFIACSSTGGDLIRRIAIVLKDCLKCAHIVPDALTFGQYMKSIASTTIKHESATDASALLDQYLYLEEIGLTWYVQKAAMSPQPIASSISSSFDKAHNSKNPANRSSSKINPISTVNREATHLVASQLHLEKSKSFMPFYFPHGVTGSCIPIKTETLTPSEILDGVTKDLQTRLDALHEASKPTDMLPEMKKALQPIIPAKSEAPPPPPSNNHGISHAISGGLSAVPFGLGSISPMRSEPSNNAAGRSPMMSGMMSRMFNTNIIRNPSANSMSSMLNISSTNNTPHTSPLPQTSSWGKFKSALGGAGMKLGGQSASASTTATPAAPDTPVPAPETTHGEPSSPIGKLSATLVFDDDEDSEGSDDGETNKSQVTQATSEVSLEPVVVNVQAEASSEDSKIVPDATGTQENTSSADATTETSTEPPSAGVASDVPPSIGSLSLSVSDSASESPVPFSLSSSVGESASAPNSPGPSSPSRTDKKTVSMPDCDKLQQTILETFLQEHARRGKAVAIHSYSPCECGFAMMDEEILSMWCHGASIDVHKQNKQKLSRMNMTLAASSKDEDQTLDGEHGELHIESGINCPHCGKDVLPQLNVKCYEIDRELSNNTTDSTQSETDSTPISGKTGDRLFSLWDEAVSYMSPFIVRFELEELILKVGESVAQSEWLHRNSPALFWNIIWYTSRCHLPTGFMPIGTKSLLPEANLFKSTYHSRLDHSAKSNQRLKDEYDLLSPVVIAWKEPVARTKALRLLQGIPGDFVDFRDILPKECSEKDVETIRDYVLPHLDGSPASLRIAMIHLADCQSLFNATKVMSGDAKGRILYSTLLMLAIHCGHYSVHDSTKTTFNRDIAKECTFHRVYLDCIRCVLSQNDFKQIEIDEESLLEFAKDYKATAVRAMFGLLL